jgi:hypothetical protein
MTAELPPCSQCGAPAHVSEPGPGPLGGIVPALQRAYPLCRCCYEANLSGLCEQCCGDDCECSCHKGLGEGNETVDAKDDILAEIIERLKRIEKQLRWHREAQGDDMDHDLDREPEKSG